MMWASGWKFPEIAPAPRHRRHGDRAAGIALVEVDLLRSRRLAVEALDHPLDLRVDLLLAMG